MCIYAVILCSTFHNWIGQFTMNMNGPTPSAMVCVCFADYVNVWYYNETACEGQDVICDDEPVRVAYCDAPQPTGYRLSCTEVVNPPQEHLCGELFDYDRDRDIDLYDFSELQNEWEGD